MKLKVKITKRKKLEFNKIQLAKLATFTDWTKSWPGATSEIVPKECYMCKTILEKPICKYKILIHRCKAFPNELISTTDSAWRIDCKECSACYLWSYPNVYRLYDKTELFDVELKNESKIK